LIAPPALCELWCAGKDAKKRQGESWGEKLDSKIRKLKISHYQLQIRRNEGLVKQAALELRQPTIEQNTV
jgi:hypothetical protein